MVSSKRKLFDSRMFPAVLSGTAVMVAVCLAMVFVLPIFIISEYFSPKHIVAVSVVVLAISTLLGSLISGYISGEKKWIAVILSAVVFYAALICSAMLFFDGVSNQLPRGLLGCTVGTICSLLIINMKKKHSNKKRKKHHHR